MHRRRQDQVRARRSHRRIGRRAQVPVEGARAGDGELKIGTLLPKTGSLAFLGPPEFAGVKLAIKEINDAGGVLGKPVELRRGRLGRHRQQGGARHRRHAAQSQNVDAIIGAASSSVTLSVIDKITTAGVVMFSPANTSKKLSTYADKGLYFRDAPSDILQGGVLADTIVGDGTSNVYILALNDDYGTGLAEDLTDRPRGRRRQGRRARRSTTRRPPTTAPRSRRPRTADPDAIVLIGFDESSKILAKMVEQGIGPSKCRLRRRRQHGQRPRRELRGTASNQPSIEHEGPGPRVRPCRVRAPIRVEPDACRPDTTGSRRSALRESVDRGPWRGCRGRAR